MLRLYKTKLQKRFLTIMGLSVIVALILFFIPICASDSDNNGVWSWFGYPQSRMGTMQKIMEGRTIFETMDKCLGEDAFEFLFQLGIVKSLLAITKIIGVAMVLIHTGMTIHKLSVTDRLDMEEFSRIMITAAVPIVIIINMDLMITGMQNLCLLVKEWFIPEAIKTEMQEIIEPLKDPNKPLDSVGTAVAAILGTIQGSSPGYTPDTEMTAMESILVWIVMLFLCFADMVIRIGIIIASIGIMGRLLLLQAFLPMSIEDIGEDGLRGHGVGMIRQYFATCLEIPVFFLLAHLGWEIFGSLISSPSSPGTMGWLLVCLIAVGTGIHTMMTGAQGIMREVTNAR